VRNKGTATARWIKHKLLAALDLAGLQVFAPIVLLSCGENPREQVRQILLFLGAPVFAFALFLGAWGLIATNIETSYGTVPTPKEVWAEARNLWGDHRAARLARRTFGVEQAREVARQEAEITTLDAQLLSTSADRRGELEAQIEAQRRLMIKTRERKFSAGPTYLDQIVTSLETVFAGFLIASAIAIPLGLLCGSNRIFLAAVNPLIQIFKPVSPLAWLPIVTIVVGATYTTDPSQAWFEKSFLTSAITVALCSMWPTLVNTALGVAAVDPDHLNVARVLDLNAITRLRKIVIPSALPLMFAGLRISLGVGWMVLIAAEMLAQNPGLGKFVWDMFQNGSSQTLAQIMVAVFTIGVIGFLLDRVMIILQRSVSYESARVS
jgi:nitrate/nitrite transport system permease protein